MKKYIQKYTKISEATSYPTPPFCSRKAEQG